MSSELQYLVKIISKYIDYQQLKKEPKSVTDILELPIDSFKFMGTSELKIIKDILKATTISDASKLNKNDPFNEIFKSDENLREKITTLKQNFPDLEFNVKKAITISSLIASIKNEPSEFEDKNQKVVVAGLDNAGKTAVISSFGGKLGIDDLASLKPTKGVVRRTIKTRNQDVESARPGNLELIIWDLGGQKKYREGYLDAPESYFIDIDLFIYVIDVQDSERFDESLDYFDKILDLLIILEENPYFLIFAHKVDPELKSDPKIQLNIEFLKDNLLEVFNKKVYNFDYEIYPTSIFTVLTKEPSFSKLLKEVINSHYSLTDPTIKKIDGLGKIMEQTINMVIRLSESLTKQLELIEHRLKAIESGAISSLASGGMPLEIEQPRFLPEKKEENVRAQVLDELKDLFDKKRRLNL